MGITKLLIFFHDIFCECIEGSFKMVQANVYTVLYILDDL